MNRVILIVIATTFLFFSCKKNQFTVSGTIEKGQGKTIMLNKTLDNVLEVIDSVKIDKDGHFELKGKIDVPSFCYLGFNQGKNYVQLIVSPGEDIVVTGNYDSFSRKYTVAGSKESELLFKHNMELYENIDRTRRLGDTFKLNLENPRLDSIRQSLDNQYIGILKQQRNSTIKFITDNINSLAVMVALGDQIDQKAPILNNDEDVKYYFMVDSSMKINHPKTDQVKALGNYVQKLKEELEARKQGEKITAIGVEAPDFKVIDRNGKEVTLSSLRGKIVLLDFWAGWCNPCRAESPNIVAAYKKFKNKGFEILQVSLDRKKEEWEAAIKKDNLGDWIHACDLKEWSTPAAILYSVRGIPANFLIDKNGKIIAKNLRGNELEIELTKVLF